MPSILDRKRVRTYLNEFNLRELFIEELGWDHGGAHTEVEVDERSFILDAVAHKRGMVAYQHVADAGTPIPEYPVRRKIEKAVAKEVREHIIVYATRDRSEQSWQWVKREPGRPDRQRSESYRRGDTGERLIQKLEDIAFTLDEEDDLTIVDVSGRVRAAFDVEKVTKRFFERFRKEHQDFLGFIEGIADLPDREWYASLMLNRMMFIYFIQKRGFLDNNTEYLRDRLDRVRREHGNGRFNRFYRLFLLKLFHEGLGQPEVNRSPELAALLGRVPFLNGGLFDVHDLERHNPDIEIPDEAFERIFDFFDSYTWHLDDRPLRNDNEINPDVLGYIFEKYINQKQMGAYYTKEDITGYISRNTIIPFIFDQAKKACPIAFRPGGGVWSLLQDEPDRYFYEAVRHGITYEIHKKEDLVRKRDLPSEIAAGLEDVAKRDGWNEPAASDYALPTETWREHVARRRHYEEVYAKLASGEVTAINDLITYNLDIEKFAQDVISGSEGPELVRAFWKAISGVSILDPTCGSGAFLFSALNILEPIYTACLEAMRGLLDDLQRSQRKHRPEKMSDFRKILKQVDSHPSERYFILKSIIINNLYGVDIMEEAVEICKLRLFLKLVAQLESYDQIEPLPDIDFNIRAGNTLVGFTSLDDVRRAVEGDWIKELSLPEIEERAAQADRAFQLFKEMQTDHEMDASAFAQAKLDLRRRLDELRDQLDGFLGGEYGVQDNDALDYDQWRQSHLPFHWFVEFYGIMHGGGFDVVVGNPPYVNRRSVDYVVRSTANLKFPDIYGYVAVQSQRILSRHGRCGLIVPLSATFSFEFSDLREPMASAGTHWFSSYDNIPAALFSGVSQRCTIWLTSVAQKTELFATRLYRWRAAFRDFLLDNLSYNEVHDVIPNESFGIPRLTNRFGAKLLSMHIQSSTSPLTPDRRLGRGSFKLGFSPTARNFISTYIEPPPVLHPDDRSVLRPSQSGWVSLHSKEEAFAALAITGGDTCFWYWLSRGDGFHVTNWLLDDLLTPVKTISDDHLHRLAIIGELLHNYRYSALVFKKNAGKYIGNFNYQKLSSLTRRADFVFLSGIGAEWADLRELFSFTSLVRGINRDAGEKNIPNSVKERFMSPSLTDLCADRRVRGIDEWISSTYSIDPRFVEELSSV